MIEVYGIKNCDTVKKALKFFALHELEYQLHDFKKESVSAQKIESWLEKTDLKVLFNARSTTYRNLKLKELNLEDNGKKEWLSKENMLIKRPVIEYNNQVIVGFNEEMYERSFL